MRGWRYVVSEKKWVFFLRHYVVYWEQGNIEIEQFREMMGEFRIVVAKRPSSSLRLLVKCQMEKGIYCVISKK